MVENILGKGESIFSFFHNVSKGFFHKVVKRLDRVYGFKKIKCLICRENYSQAKLIIQKLCHLRKITNRVKTDLFFYTTQT